MRYGDLVLATGLLVCVSLMTGCGSVSGGSPPNIYSGSVFISDRDVAGTYELFISNDDGTEVVKLSDTLVSNGDVKSFQVNPNIGFMAYLADQDTDGVDELYYIKQSEGVPTKVNAALSPGQNVLKYEWSPNGLYIAYIADQDTPGINELFISDADTVIKISPSGLSGEVIDFKWSANSQQVAYTAKVTPTSNAELYYSQSDGALVAVQLSDSASIGAGVVNYEWSADSNHIAYLADENTAGVIELFTVAVDSNTKVTVSDITDGDVYSFRWSHGGALLAYTANRSAADGVDLFVTATDNNSNVSKVSDVTTAGGNVTSDFLWAPNDTLLAYVADQDVDELFELFFTRIDGSSTGTKLSSAMVAGGDVDVTDGFLWTHTSDRLIYRADQETDEVFELYSSTIDGDVSTMGVKISADLVSGGDVGDQFTLSPFGSVVAYIADQVTDEVFELYATTITENTNALKMSADLDVTRRVFQHGWSADGNTLFYIADQDVDGVNDVYITNISDAISLNLSGAPTIGSGITQGALIDNFGVSDNLFPL